MRAAKNQTLQSAIDNLLDDESVRREVEAEAQALIAASDLLVELDNLRQSIGISKADLARRAGLQPSNLRKILSAGTGRLELVTYLKLVAALGHDLKISSRAEMPALEPQGKRTRFDAPHRKSRQLSQSF